MIKELIRYFRDEPREFVRNIVRDIDNDEWKMFDGYSFGPSLSSPTGKLVLHETFEAITMYRYMELYYSNPGHRNQIFKLNYKEQRLLWDAAYNALDRLRKGLRKQADDYIEAYVEDFDETRI